MTDLDKQILQKATGETRLNPDEQRRYFGTFRERVVLTIALQEAQTEGIQKTFSQALERLLQTFSPLSVKISPKLSTETQIFYMKKAQDKGCSATIVDETAANSPFGIIVHTNKAENIESTDFAVQFPDLLEAKPTPHPQKESFFKKLFGH
ncbi:MAG: YueI family protein [Streptococcus hyointestinalis]|nr:YueI family protein [Streptococcus hyointestinalis]MDD6384431.1 YueI family protein [Streptococcus hyointestinalis]